MSRSSGANIDTAALLMYISIYPKASGYEIDSLYCYYSSSTSTCNACVSLANAGNAVMICDDTYVVFTLQISKV